MTKRFMRMNKVLGWRVAEDTSRSKVYLAILDSNCYFMSDENIPQHIGGYAAFLLTGAGGPTIWEMTRDCLIVSVTYFQAKKRAATWRKTSNFDPSSSSWSPRNAVKMRKT